MLKLLNHITEWKSSRPVLWEMSILSPSGPFKAYKVKSIWFVLGGPTKFILALVQKIPLSPMFHCSEDPNIFRIKPSLCSVKVSRDQIWSRIYISNEKHKHFVSSPPSLMSWPEWPVRGRWGQQRGTQHWTLGNSVRHRWAEKQGQVRWIWGQSSLVFCRKHCCSPGVYLVLSFLCDAQSCSLWKHVAQKDLPVIWCLCSS